MFIVPAHTLPKGIVFTLEVFVNNTNLTFLSFLYKISIKVSEKNKVPPVGFELTTLTITGLQV